MADSDNDARQAFEAAIPGLLRGDFSRLALLFEPQPNESRASRITEWLDNGWFDAETAALDEAFTCACFLGHANLVARLLGRGIDPLAGFATGLNGFHWAANRGQLAVVNVLIEKQVPLEIKNMYGGTVLDCAVWSVINEPRPDHLAIIAALLNAGADPRAVGYPSGNQQVDELLAQHGAKS